MTAHLAAQPGLAADFAAGLTGRIPQIATTHTRLRAPHLGDAPAWTALLCGPATEFLGGPYSESAAFDAFSAGVGMWLLRGHGLWSVEDSATGTLLGFVLLGFESGDLEPELGYLFLPQAEGKGLAYEAACAARDHARALALPSLVSYVAPGNHRSARLAARLGARPEPGPDGSTCWRHWTVEVRQ